MADPISNFRMKFTGMSHSKSDDGRLLSSAHFDGTADGFGAVMGSVNLSQTLEESRKTSGTCSWAAQIFGEDGTTTGNFAEGTWEQVSGENVWKLIFHGETPDGRRVRSEGVVNLAERSYNGSIFEA